LHQTYPPDLAFSYYPSLWLAAAQVAMLLIAAALLIVGLRLVLLRSH
jgi:hypothetical protein